MSTSKFTPLAADCAVNLPPAPPAAPRPFTLRCAVCDAYMPPNSAPWISCGPCLTYRRGFLKLAEQHGHRFNPAEALRRLNAMAAAGQL